MGMEQVLVTELENRGNVPAGRVHLLSTRNTRRVVLDLDPLELVILQLTNLVGVV